MASYVCLPYHRPLQPVGILHPKVDIRSLMCATIVVCALHIEARWAHSSLHNENVPLVETIYLIFTRIPGESYRRRFRFLLLYLLLFVWRLSGAPQWGAADAEIKVPSGENTELKRSPFQAWSRSVYSYTCYAYCQGVLSWLFLPFQSIHLHFFQNLSQFFPVLACRIKEVTLLDAGSLVECPRHINRLKKHDLWKVDDLWNNIQLGVIVKVCVQPWCSPSWLTGLKAPTN